jgi:hypothetical protein
MRVAHSFYPGYRDTLISLAFTSAYRFTVHA